MSIRARDWRALREALRCSASPDRVLELACLDIARDEAREAGRWDPEEIKARAGDLGREARERMEAVGA